jgi:hypothetical protein
MGHYYGRYGFEAFTHAKSMLIAPDGVAAQLQRECGPAGADCKASEPPRVQCSCEKRRAGSDIGSYDMRMLEAGRVRNSDGKLAHRPW